MLVPKQVAVPDRRERAPETRSRFETAFANAPIGMALVSIQGQWLEVNDAFCQIEKTIAEFVPDEATCRLLEESGVDYGQGYHVGAARPLREVLPFRE